MYDEEQQFDDDDELTADEEGDDEDGYDEEGDDDTIPCPYCRRPIHDDAPQCPYCHNYLSEEDAPPQRKPWWIVVGFVCCGLIVLMWLIWR
ncbi:MAG: zinc ribbon domain-containing protein [Planctomycetia bacterium]|nr:zinc ribbon domain-containing protein [Planctomycetia bacterium]